MRRRVAAVVLLRLAVELAARAGAMAPVGVVVREDGMLGPDDIIGHVSDDARRYGVRPGRRICEALELLPRLAITTVTHAEMDAALARVAAVVMPFGRDVAVQINESIAGLVAAEVRSATGAGPFDTVWLDVTDSGDDEGQLARMLEGLAVTCGHEARVAIADGPRIAQALARWGTRWEEPLVAEEGSGAAVIASLPVRALPLPADRVAFLLRIGVLTIGDLAKLPRHDAMNRLGARGAVALALASGHDPATLVPFAPPSGTAGRGTT